MLDEETEYEPLEEETDVEVEVEENGEDDMRDLSWIGATVTDADPITVVGEIPSSPMTFAQPGKVLVRPVVSVHTSRQKTLLLPLNVSFYDPPIGTSKGNSVRN